MRILIKLDIPDYNGGMLSKQMCDLLCQLSDEMGRTAWQAMSGRVAGWEVEKPT